MLMTLGRRLFLYTSSLLILLLLATFFWLARTQSEQWERHFHVQAISFARLATPELLKRFRGDFAATSQQTRDRQPFDFLAFNRDLVDFTIISSGNRPLFRSARFPGYLDLESEGPLLRTPVVEATADGVAVAVQSLADGQRLLVLTVPAFGPTGESVLLVRYRLSYASIDSRIRELRGHLLLIAAVSCGLSLIFAALFARRVAQPLKALTQGAKAIGQGRLEVRINVAGADELGALGVAFNHMAENLQLSNQELTAKHAALERVNHELQQMQQQLVRSERLAAIGQLAAGVSHEIDNPVGIILGYAELLLEDTPVDDPRHEDLMAIVDECKRCRRITGGLLGFARSSPGHYVALDLTGLVRLVLDSFRPQRLFKNLRIEVVAPSDPQMVLADADQLRQVLVNLLLNAAQAMNGDGQLVLTLTATAQKCLLTIDDSGPGVEVTARERIFEPFYSTKGRGEGTGLGLSICRRLIEEHGGQLTVTDAPLGGARFLIILPCNLANNCFDKDSPNSLG